MILLLKIKIESMSNRRIYSNNIIVTSIYDPNEMFLISESSFKKFKSELKIVENLKNALQNKNCKFDLNSLRPSAIQGLIDRSFACHFVRNMSVRERENFNVENYDLSESRKKYVHRRFKYGSPGIAIRL